MLVVSSKSNLGCEAGCGLGFGVGSCSDHSRIVPALEMTFHLFLDIFFEILLCHFVWQAQHLVRLEGDTCCSAHCKCGLICDEDEPCVSLFVAGAVLREVQVSLLVAAQYLVKFKCHFWWQVQYLVKFKCHFLVAGAVLGEGQVSLFVAGAVYLVKVKCHFSWQVQYLVKVKCHFSWQVQYLVNF